jgi:thiamine biosynthesis lipoprotein
MPAQTFYALGTVCAINLFEDGTEERYAQMGARLYEIHKLFSVNIAASDVAAINQNAGISAVSVHDDVLYVTRMALYFAQKTGGVFDPSIGALSVLWGIGSEDARVPAQNEIDVALALVDYRQIDIDEAAKTVFLRQKGMILDLGGIAKGYAADEMVRIAREHGVKRALIDLGGNVYVFGAKPNGDAWRVAVKNPENPAASPAAILELGENSVVTSGAYERFFEQDGTRYHHILDAKTGYPAQSGVLSATIISTSSLAADALSTSVFVLGKDNGASLLRAGFAEAGISAEGLILAGDHSARATSGIRAAVTMQGDYFMENF